MKHAIAFTTWWILVATFPPSNVAASAPEPSPWCLPPETGQRLRTVVESESVHAVLGEAFALERADIQGAVVELEIRSDSGEFAKARLRPARPGPEPGRWFEVQAKESSSPQATEVMERLAAIFNEGFFENPFVPCHRAGSRPGIPRWWYLLSGVFQWLLLAIGLAAAFRRPPLEGPRD